VWLPFATGVLTEEIQERFLLQKAMSMPALQVNTPASSSCLAGLALLKRKEKKRLCLWASIS